MSITWNTGLAAARARHNLKLKNKKRPAARKLQAASRKPQASSATKRTQLKCINNLERRNYENIKTRMAGQS